MSTSIDPENLLTAIHHRRSFKPNMLKPDPVPRELLEKILEAAQWALNHGRTQPWHYTVFTGDARKTLGEAFAHAYQLEATKTGNFVQSTLDSQHKKVLDAPVWIAIALKPGVRPDGSPAMPLEEEIMAVACSVQLLHLAASAFGLGGQWTSSPTGLHSHVANFIGLQPPARLLGFFYLGYPAIPWPERKPPDLATHVAWREEPAPVRVHYSAIHHSALPWLRYAQQLVGPRPCQLAAPPPPPDSPTSSAAPSSS